MDEKESERILKALANRRRLLMLKILKKNKRLSVGEMATKIKLSFRSTSKHLSLLYGVGFLEREQESLTAYYSISPKFKKIISEALSVI